MASTTAVVRVCKECGQGYSVEELLEDQPYYFDPPHDYWSGAYVYCLACWLCVGPNDFPTEESEPTGSGGATVSPGAQLESS